MGNSAFLKKLLEKTSRKNEQAVQKSEGQKPGFACCNQGKH